MKMVWEIISNIWYLKALGAISTQKTDKKGSKRKVKPLHSLHGVKVIKNYSEA